MFVFFQKKSMFLFIMFLIFLSSDYPHGDYPGEVRMKAGRPSHSALCPFVTVAEENF